MWDKIERIDDEAERVAKLVFSRPDAVAEAVLYRHPLYVRADQPFEAYP